MYSWEIDEYLRKHDYKITFQETRDIMEKSPQIINWKMEQLFSEIDGYGKYLWKTDDNYQWLFYIKNKEE